MERNTRFVTSVARCSKLVGAFCLRDCAGRRRDWVRGAWVRDAWVRDAWVRDAWVRDAWVRDDDARDDDGGLERPDCVDDRRVPFDEESAEVDLGVLRRDCDGLVDP
jgi:hypothetical protein